MAELAAKTDTERKQTLATTVTNRVAQGRRVESQTDFQAILVHGHRPNHLLHLIVTLCTLGLWGLVWLGIAVLGGEKRETVQIDEWGNIQIQRL